MAVKMSELVDLLNTTKEQLPDNRFTQVQRLQKYHAVDMWFGQEREEYVGGDKLVRDIQLDDSGTAQHSRPMQKRTVNAVQTMEQFDTPWVHADTYYVISRREALANRGEEAFISLIKTKRNAALMALANELEDHAWGTPSAPAQLDLFPLGMQYWLPPMDPTAAGAGFYGGRVSTDFNDVAGIAPATSNDNTPSISGGEEMWRHYQAGGHDGTNEWYLSVNNALINTMRRVFYKINFRSPQLRGANDSIVDDLGGFRIYMGTAPKIQFDDLVDTKNKGEGYGHDVDKFAGQVAFKRVPILHAPTFDDEPNDPIRFVNHDHWKPYVRTGEFLREDDARNPADHPDVMIVWINLEYNFMLENRRENAVLTKAADNSGA